MSPVDDLCPSCIHSLTHMSRLPTPASFPKPETMATPVHGAGEQEISVRNPITASTIDDLEHDAKVSVQISIG